MTYIITAAIAVAFAVFEAHEINRRTRQRDYRNLPHAWLAIARFCTFLLTILLTGAPLWSLIPMGALFAPIHRTTLNIRRGVPWWWMGGDERTDADSWYDTFWHWLTCDVTYPDHDADGEEFTVYIHSCPCLPYLAATIAEALVFILTA